MFHDPQEFPVPNWHERALSMQHCCSEMRAGTRGQKLENSSRCVCRGIQDGSSNLYRIRIRVSIVSVIIKRVKGIPRVFCLTGRDSLISPKQLGRLPRLSRGHPSARSKRLACLHMETTPLPASTG